MSSVFTLLLARETRLLFRRPAELANPLVFFAIVIALFPLAVGPETQLLQTISPGLVWVAALLAVLLSLDGLFRSDFEDGSLEQWVVSPHPLALLVLAKVLAHWAFSGLALVLLAPLLLDARPPDGDHPGVAGIAAAGNADPQPARCGRCGAYG